MTSKRRKKHKPEQIVAKLRDADAMLNAGKDLAAVLQALEISEATLHRWRSECFSSLVLGRGSVIEGAEGCSSSKDGERGCPACSDSGSERG